MRRHLSPEFVAAFAEGNLGEIDYARVYSHLRCCSECFDAYQYTLRCFGVHLDEWAESSAPPEETRRVIEKIAERRETGVKPPRRRRIRFRFGPALVVAFVVAVWWLRSH